MAIKPKLIIDAQTRRRFILGKQGLWPGRRWRGKTGLEKALRAVEMVQIDPTVVVAQSQDIVLYGRVLDYEPQMLTELLYKDRKFFDYGGGLTISPMEEMPYTRMVMRNKAKEKRWVAFAKKNAKLVLYVKREVARRGPTRSRDLEGAATANYRSGKDTGVALYYLWLSGELMISRREGKERAYDLIENLVPKKHAWIATVAESEDYFARKAVSLGGIINQRSFRNSWKSETERFADHAEGKTKLARMLKAGLVTEIGIQDQREPYYILSKDLPNLEIIAKGGVPKSWKPLDTSTEDEVIFLSPLELVSARGRAKILFDFDHLWEIYKPDSKRKYGPYTMPILYGDQLVARADFKMDRAQGKLMINGFWAEAWFKPDKKFAKAFSKGLDRFAEFLKAKSIDRSKIKIK